MYFRGKYAFLSNLATCDFYYEGVHYTSAEAAYQAAKTDDKKLKETISKMSPEEALVTGEFIKVRGGFEDEKLYIMESILRRKFANPKFRKLLLGTGDEYIEETNHWQDRYWGVCSGEGENRRGKILMKIREELSDS